MASICTLFGTTVLTLIVVVQHVLCMWWLIMHSQQINDVLRALHELSHSKEYTSIVPMNVHSL